MKKINCLLLTLVVTLSAMANPIDRKQARQEAEKFLQTKGATISGEAARSIRRKTSLSEQPLYIFNVSNNRGFVIVAGDDRIEPIIGYTTQGSFDEGDLPENFRAWLEQTAAEIESLKDNSSQAHNASAQRAIAKEVVIHNAIDPLIITTWNQGNTDNVYNSHLPLVNGARPCTGCVATAGAQIMYYYHRDLPDMTLPVPHYKLTDEYGNDVSHGADTSNDLPAIQFQWDKMKTSYDYKEPDTPNTEEEDAVADLMLYCGYAAHMNYGLSDKHGGSSASASTLSDGMSKYFGFNPNTWKLIARSYYSISEWDELVYNELACGRPVLYSGSYEGGHVFICDGYDGAGMYHFNWGWGGNYNGFFKLQATNPKGVSNITDMGYIEDNYCIIGLQPISWPDIPDPNADDTWEIPVIEGIVATASKVTIENTTVSMRLSNNNEETYGFGFGIGELYGDGTIAPIDTKKENYKNSELPTGYGFPSVSFDFSSYDLSEGTHMLVPISIVNGESEWRRCKPADLYFEVNVSGGVKTIIVHPVEDLQINEFDLASGGTPGYSQGIILNITNNGDNLEKSLYIFVGTADDKGKNARSKTVCIASGNTKEYRLSISKLDAGNYTLRLMNNKNGDVVLAQKDITISQDLQATNFEISGKKKITRTLKVDVTVENHAGDYAVPLYLFASKTDSKKFVYAAGSAIESGSSEVVTFYFQPDQPGIWNLWVATDKNANNIIGESQVEIEEPHPANLSITSQVQNLSGYTVKAENYVVKVDVTNIGDYAYDDLIEARLYKLEPGTNSGSLVDMKTHELNLEAGNEASFNFTFDNLEDGSSYFYYIYYYSIEGSSTKKYRASGGYTYTFEYTSGAGDTTAGDANGDKEVNAQDIVDIVNHMMGNAISTGIFDEEAADMNNDNVVNIADIIILTNMLLEQ